MKHKILGAFAAIALLAGAAVAIQLNGDVASSQNVVGERLEGTWLLDPELTGKLDPNPDFTAPPKIQFTKNDKILVQLQGFYPRFKSQTIYMSGTAVMSGTDHWFVVVNENGNNHLVLFTPSRTSPVAEPHHFLADMALSRNKAKDFLFLGGTVDGKSSAAYVRAN